jgi:hypothetical protein
MSKKPLEIDMIAGSMLRDTQGEMLSIEGADISELEAGRGRLNDNHGQGFFNSIGRITFAKKILKAEDCNDERQKYYWQKVKAPYLYCRGYLYDDTDDSHANAKAAAAILRSIHKADAPLKLKASVEGGVVSRGVKDPSLLARTKIHSVALTFTPANNATLVEPLNLNKANIDETADRQLIESVIHLAQTNVPSFRHITRDASAQKIENNIERINRIASELKIDSDIRGLSKAELIEQSLTAKITNNVAEIERLVSSFEGDDMNKGLKELAAGAAMLGAAHMSSSPEAVAGKKLAQPAPAVSSSAVMASSSKKQPHPSYSKNKNIIESLKLTHPLLAAIADYESSGGKFLDHATIMDPTSIHYGHTAGSMYGLMPNSVAQTIKTNPSLKKKYPKLADLASDVGKNHKQITSMLNADPDIATGIAKKMFISAGSDFEDDPHLTIHSWNHGVHGTKKKLADEKRGKPAIVKDDYVANVMQRFMAHRGQPIASTTEDKKPASSDKKINLNKALTAGYGGAGAPSAMTGGSVIQSEALNMGPSDLRSAVCDKCGKEQIYAKFQVKCRSCGAPFSLDKIYNILSR